MRVRKAKTLAKIANKLRVLLYGHYDGIPIFLGQGRMKKVEFYKEPPYSDDIYKYVAAGTVTNTGFPTHVIWLTCWGRFVGVSNLDGDQLIKGNNLFTLSGKFNDTIIFP